MTDDADRCGMPTGIPGGCPLPGDHDGACQPEPVRCRCSHAKSQHYRDRKGRPMCVGPCACPGYRPAPVIHEDLLTPTGCTQAEAHAAARTVCGNATDSADAARLLAACGLIDTTKETP